MINERYKILKIIGEGGFSTIYKGHDIQLNIDVGIKTIKPGSKEIDIIKNLCYDPDGTKHIHENIIQVLNIIEANDLVYIIFELCEMNLIDFANEYELNEDNILKILRMILLGINFIHNRGIIHRDIKLSNILIKNNIIKICDFGLSCFENANNFSLCGTVDYMAPELLNIKNDNKNEKLYYTNKIDLYSVGILAKMLLHKTKANNIQNTQISKELTDFIQLFLEQNSNIRLSAINGLKHTIFDKFFKQIPNFKLIKKFQKKTEYGIIERRDNFISMKYDENIIKICYSDNFCSIHNNKNIHCNNCIIISNFDHFDTYILFNDKKIEKYLLTNTQLKYYNYICGYLDILSSTTIIHTIRATQYIFNYFLNNHWEYKTDKFTIKKIKDGYNLNGIIVQSFPKELSTLKSYIEVLITRAEKAIRRYDQIEYAIDTTDLNLTVKSNRIVINEIYIENIGWMYHSKDTYKILLNNGVKINLTKDFNILYICNADDIELKKDYNVIKKIISLFVKKLSLKQ
ncbi:serine/threonine protein kinase [Enterocytozoon bieneusi H348]|nr:serine/threonine protein kinase [Enterocytozoon bieneusi H348]|eukprot:XP_002649780.1 serine/threonine protein kinase [Enterocytozoon bieneusi H348]